MKLVSDVHEHQESWRSGDLTIIRCIMCGFRHQSPIPSEADIRSTYEERFGGDVRKDFIRHKQKDAKYWAQAFERRRLRYEELLPGRQGRRLLDVGCGTGDLLYHFKTKGWDVHGIEPSQNFAPVLAERDIPVTAKLAEDLTPSECERVGHFDVINMAMVLEHVREPITLVREITAKLLSPGGILTLETPNDFNPLQKAAVAVHGLDQWWIDPLHINYFDFETLETLSTRCGLEPVLREAQFPMEMFLLFGDKYVGSAETGRNVHQKRVAFETAMHRTDNVDLLRDLYTSLGRLGLGRTAIVHARKSP